MIPIETRIKIHAPNYPQNPSEKWERHLVKIGGNHGQKGVVVAHDLPWSHLVELNNGQKIWVWERELKKRKTEDCPHDFEHSINGRCPICRERKDGH